MSAMAVASGISPAGVPIHVTVRMGHESGAGCAGRPAGGQRPVKKHGCGGGEQRGSECDHGDLPACHATHDHTDGGRRYRRDAGGAALASWRWCLHGESSGGSGGKCQQAADESRQGGGATAEACASMAH